MHSTSSRPDRFRSVRLWSVFRSALLCLGLGVSAAAYAERAPDLLESSRAWLEQGKPELALSRLGAEEHRRAGESAFDLLLGWALMASGRDDEAAFALERVLMLDRQQSQAHLQLAMLAKRRGDTPQAEAHFRRVDAERLPPIFKPEWQRLRDALFTQPSPQAGLSGNDPGKPGGQGTRLAGNLLFGMGYDTNVTSGPHAEALILPGISSTLPILLGRSSRQGSPLLTVTGNGSFLTPLTSHTAVGGALSVTQNALSQRQDLDETTITGMLGVSHVMAGDTVSLAGFSQDYRVDKEAYRSFWGGATSWSHPLNDRHTWIGHVQYLNDDYPFYPRDSMQRVAGGMADEIALDKKGAHVSGGWRVGREWPKDDAAPQVGLRLVGLDLGTKWPVSETVTAQGLLQYERKDYDARDLYHLWQRNDDLWTLGGFVDWEYARHWHLMPSITHLHNQSNLALYQYDRTLITLALRWDFVHEKQ
ncbi:MAG: DUF560 domain-containing protein [Magnetococcales bacterium]|nr:DUF560 domain-containing protein [Magnetococcales bacterium]